MNNFPDKHFEFEVEPKPDDIRALEEGIYAFNVQATGISDGKPFGLFLRDADGTAIGGVHGWTWGRTCYISLLFVPAHLRNRPRTSAQSRIRHSIDACRTGGGYRPAV